MIIISKMFSTPCFCHGPTVRTSKQKRLHNSSRILCCTRRNSQTTDGVKTTSISDAKFSTWASENKVDMSSLILTKSKKTHFSNITSNRGMTAKVPLKKGDMMISVPKNVSLQVSSLDTKKTPFPEKITQETWQTLPWFVRLAFRILDAKSDPESILHPWIARLPRSFDTPFHWSEAELAELQSPRMVNEVTEQKKKYRKYFDDIIRNPGNTLLRNFTYSDFVWAVECVRSRAFSGPQEVAPFKERASLLLFVLANTLAWPALHILSFENAVNGT